MSADLQILTRTYDLILWTLNHTQKFPRGHRYSLGQRLEERLYSLLDDLVAAKYTRDKSQLLRDAALKLEQARYQFRLAKDLKILPFKSHHHALLLIEEIGKQLGGWRRNLNKRTSTPGES